MLAKIEGHAIFLSQLNQDGTTKGGTELPHYVDQVFPLNKIAPNGGDIKGLPEGETYFFMHQGDKNRYGRTCHSIGLDHTDRGVECNSNTRWYAMPNKGDSDWWDYGKAPTSISELPSNITGKGRVKKKKAGVGIGMIIWCIIILIAIFFLGLHDNGFL